MFFSPKWYHYLLIVLLLPLSVLYGIVMWFRRVLTPKQSFDIPILSVGNLIVGGSGKTPFTITIASTLENVTIISRGYGRKSSGLIEVSREGQILVNVELSGDEPMLMAQSLPNASVIVSEDRQKAIELAKQNGARVIILDDGFNRVEIEKLEILLEPERVKNFLPFPAGPFREFWFSNRYADLIAKEGRDFSRDVTITDPSEKMLLVTAISNPGRLDKYLPDGVIERLYLPDHDYFDESEIRKLMEECGAVSILCTEKDRVKMQDFSLPVSEMKLRLNIDNAIMKAIGDYISKNSDKS